MAARLRRGTTPSSCVTSTVSAGQTSQNATIVKPFVPNKAFRHVKTLFVQGNQVRTDQNKPSLFFNKKEDLF